MKNLVIDARNLCFRGSAISNDLINSKGDPVGVVYTFLQVLRKLIYSYQADRVFVVWDSGTSQWRKGLYPDYKKKKNRNKNKTVKATIEAIRHQQRTIQDVVLPMLPAIQFSSSNTEADDCICAICCVLNRLPNQEILIASTDNDFYQLLGIANMVNDTVFTKEDFLKKFGFPFTSFLPYRAMVGDSSDCIKGVTGIGEKTATKILSNYSNVEDFLEDEEIAASFITNVKGKKKNLLAELDVFKRNIKLIDLLNYPERNKLMNEFISVFNSSSATFLQQEFKQYLLGNKMFSILGNFNRWKNPFIKLEELK